MSGLPPIEFVMSDLSVDLGLGGGEVPWSGLLASTKATPDRLNEALDRLIREGYVAEMEAYDCERTRSSFLLLRAYQGEPTPAVAS